MSFAPFLHILRMNPGAQPTKQHGFPLSKYVGHPKYVCVVHHNCGTLVNPWSLVYVLSVLTVYVGMGYVQCRGNPDLMLKG